MEKYQQNANLSRGREDCGGGVPAVLFVLPVGCGYGGSVLVSGFECYRSFLV